MLRIQYNAMRKKNFMITSCPDCKNSADKVQFSTLKSQLSNSFSPSSDDYFVCSQIGCSTVYFSPSNTHKYLLSDLKQPFGLKEKTTPRTICYCFNYSIEEALTKDSNIIERIKQHMQVDKCKCITTNPLGKCCLQSITNLLNIDHKDSNCC